MPYMSNWDPRIHDTFIKTHLQNAGIWKKAQKTKHKDTLCQTCVCFSSSMLRITYMFKGDMDTCAVRGILPEKNPHIFKANQIPSYNHIMMI